MTNFGKSLHEYRMKKDWTLRQLSFITGVSISALQCAEKGTVKKSADRTRNRIKNTLPDFRWEN